MRILFLTPYPKGAAPSQRFRFEQYYQALSAKGIAFESCGFWDDKTWEILYKPGHHFRKIFGLFSGFVRRFFLLFRLGNFNYVFIHREADPLCTGIFPFFISKVFGKKIIYDFDDAIWIPNSSESNRFFMKFKNWNNTSYLSKLAYKVSVGNDYLCRYASQFNSNVVYLPTTIDTENLHNQIKNQTNTKFVIGWTGTLHTINYLYDLWPVFERLETQMDFELAIICDKEPEKSLKSLRWIPWNKSQEIEDLLSMNIGLMPLRKDQWSEGKCGFKALQYMSLGIPALVSPVGVNSQIVDDHINGFICEKEEDWERNILDLYQHRNKLMELAENTRKKIQDKYSVQAHTKSFVNLFS